MSKVDGDLIQSILWYAIAAIWALIAIARWLGGEHLRASVGDG